MHSSVNNKRLSCGIAERTVAKSDNGFCNILGLSPTLDGEETAVNQLIVFFGHRFGHGRCDDTGTGLVNGNAVFRKAHGILEKKMFNGISEEQVEACMTVLSQIEANLK